MYPRLFQPLVTNISSKVDLTNDQLNILVSAFKIKQLRKKENLLTPGNVSNHLNFVSSGCLRVYGLEGDREIISQFGIEGWCVNDMASFLGKKPATQFIEAIEPSVILQIHRDALEKLYVQVPPMERFFRIKFQDALTVLQQRHVQTISVSARERYEQFRNQYREIEQRVPQYMIASYLGITKEFLSHIRKTY
jgi:CRP/FNR family transcriptional regulator, anaerobic regulatory protein